MTKIRRTAILLLATLAPVMAGCDFSIVEGVNATGSISISLTPTAAKVAPGRSVQLTARVSGTADTTVLWSVESGPGQVYSDGLYVAPTTIAADPASVTVRVRAGADTTVAATATITVTADTSGGGDSTVLVTVDPSTASILTGETAQFTATVTGSTNTAVTWSVVTGPGQITPLGKYVAPATVGSVAVTVTIQATAGADPTAIGRATVRVTPAPGSNDVCFERDILPLLNSSCAMSGCHDAVSHEEDYVLTSYSGIMRGIKANRPDDSEIFKKVTETDATEMMPPPPAQRLTAQQIETLRRWIMEGARNTSCTPPPDQCDTTNVTYTGTIRTVLDNYCMGCHSGSTLYNGYVSLESYADVLVVATNGRLYGAIAHQPGYRAMPQSLPKFDDCTIRQFKKWIDLGAPEK